MPLQPATRCQPAWWPVAHSKINAGTAKTRAHKWNLLAMDSFSWPIACRYPEDMKPMPLSRGGVRALAPAAVPENPSPLAFTTEFPSEMVVIQYDGRTDRIAVLYGMSYGLSWLGFGWGTGLIAAVAIVGSLILGAQIAYTRVVLHPERQYRAGCPNCQQHNLQRISRESKDYLLETIGIPVRRYKCRSCGWEGRRIQRNPHHP